MFRHPWKRWGALPNELAPPMRPIAAAALLAALLLSILALVLGGCEPSPPPTPQEAQRRAEEKQEEDRKWEAVVLSREAVRKHLKFPLDAEFPWAAPEVARSAEGDIFWLQGTVKAKNALGASLTSTWISVVVFGHRGDVPGEVVALDIDGQTLYGKERARELLSQMREQAGRERSGTNEPPRVEEAPIAQPKSGPKDAPPAVAKKSQPADRETEQEQRAEVSKAEPEPTLRTWTDETGEYKVEAEFVSYTAGTVKLRKKEGQIVKLPVKRLSEADQEWIRQRGRR